MRQFLCIALACCLPAGVALAAQAFTLSDAIKEAVRTNPGVGEAAANRRATETELRQNQSTLLPQVRLEAKYGEERFEENDIVPPPQGDKSWLRGDQASVVVRQLLFDGFKTVDQIWRQAARVDSAAYRVYERSELIALDAAEAYIDVIRYTDLIRIAQQNLAAHNSILSNVQARFNGGRAGNGDLQQIRERVEAAGAALTQFQQQLEDARAAYRKTVGIEPYNLRFPGRLPGLPASRDEALAVTLQHNPTIKAAQADADAAKYDFKSTASAFMPTISLEGRAVYGQNVDTIYGRQSDIGGFVVASWDIFRGGQDSWARAEAAERYEQQTMHHAELQREAFQSIDKAWNARTITDLRIAKLERQVADGRQVITAYQKEYQIGQRSLIDLLVAQNDLFNSMVSLESARGVAVFADYQLLAAMGQLLDYLNAPHPIDAEPLLTKPYGLWPTKPWPIISHLPETGSKPLNVGGQVGADFAASNVTATNTAPYWSASIANSPQPAPANSAPAGWASTVLVTGRPSQPIAKPSEETAESTDHN